MTMRSNVVSLGRDRVFWHISTDEGGDQIIGVGTSRELEAALREFIPRVGLNVRDRSRA